MEENLNELMVVEDSEIEEAEDYEYEEEAEGGISWGALIAGIGFGALGAIGVRKGVNWWRNRKLRKQTPVVELVPDDEDDFTEEDDSEE